MTGGHSEPTSPPEGRFGAETTGTLKRALQYYLEYEREFVTLFFPRIAERNYVTLADVAEMTPRQADALRPLLADSVRYFRRKEEQEPARPSPPLYGTPGAADPTTDLARKARLWADALRELCASFELSDPLESDS
jgi:hypothetical protein